MFKNIILFFKSLFIMLSSSIIAILLLYLAVELRWYSIVIILLFFFIVLIGLLVGGWVLGYNFSSYGWIFSVLATSINLFTIWFMFLIIPRIYLSDRNLEASVILFTPTLIGNSIGSSMRKAKTNA